MYGVFEQLSVEILLEQPKDEADAVTAFRFTLPIVQKQPLK